MMMTDIFQMFIEVFDELEQFMTLSNIFNPYKLHLGKEVEISSYH